MFTTNAHRQIVIRKIQNHMAAKGIKPIEVREALGIGSQAFKRRMTGELDLEFGEILAIAKKLEAAPSALLPDDINEVAA